MATYIVRTAGSERRVEACSLKEAAAQIARGLKEASVEYYSHGSYAGAEVSYCIPSNNVRGYVHVVEATDASCTQRRRGHFGGIFY